MKGRVLIIAGSDSGGGAGLQADLKTVTALGGFAATAVTALTAQDTTGVHGIHEVPTAFIAQQIDVVLADIGADSIKTGMLHSAEVIATVVDCLEARAPDVPLVVDPVMVAKGGARLLLEEAEAALSQRLLPRATLLTPNLPEAEALCGHRIADEAGMAEAGRALCGMGAKAVLMKGGHLPGDVVSDILVTASGVESFSSPRLQSRHTHGTGCTLASALAVGLAQGLELTAAVVRARDYVLEAIRRAPGLGAGHGPLDHGHTFGATKS
ncbi:MAG: bifunctional hydroxymethylpyrimidine kinase/phosphomethylpyrimidine kinase [Alphaproteobacteria bacterium]|nr:bifunctional hydroxymethylpyrimidine kinase/phosphomethylpyrimidine kinase [Rhodospirillaceae bacterium]MDP6406161.1 bifunctional hydroxymethylpyrimidine kinase/phosphomethylpyrimidine kinase [Alphaproteobacteria bacterium]MDP6623309.1 bifunctional hydroxymethylpyrimidine kinase/phosphomethylpyrimidine kinase [Alphaproteobacteria bacterium]